MSTTIPDNHTIQGGSFLMGMITGSAIAAGLALYFAPRLAAELRRQVTDSATALRHTASERVQAVANRAADIVDRVADAADDVTRRGQAVRDDVADAVEHGAHAVSRSAHEVERFARASKTERNATRS